MITADKVLKVARNYLGVTQGSATHRQIIDRYNQVRPLPVGYAVTYDDDWCDAFVTVVSDEAQAAKLIGRECGVQRHIHGFVEKGIWLGRALPKPGDIITFDWDGAGFADHIGFVEKFDGANVTTIEGNTNRQVARNVFKWNSSVIKGYARPQYATAASRQPLQSVEAVAREITAGEGGWGNGPARWDKLAAAGYDARAVQIKVNELLTKPKQGKVKWTATKWQTGQFIAPWVKGKTFKVVQEKAVKQSRSRKAYLLASNGQVMGWVLDQDVELI